MNNQLRDNDPPITKEVYEEFYATGKIEEGKEWFEAWLEKKPHNENALCAYSWCIQENEGAEKAYQLVKREIADNTCSTTNSEK